MAGPKPLIAGNWKMNGLTADGTERARRLAALAREAGTPSFDLLVCPPATLIAGVVDAIGDAPVAVGGQDCHPDAKGAHTGDISAEMLADIGCRWVIVGHSERRQDHREDDPLIWSKAVAARRAGLGVIVCVGETEVERDRGAALDVVRKQVIGCLPDAAGASDTVIAYEPVWAIGTGRTPTPGDIAEVHGLIRELVSDRARDGTQLRILYGGSVKASNAAEILAIDDVDGALVGGASLDADEFWRIARSSR
jgi:triosephosphate isomerase (TIM)